MACIQTCTNRPDEAECQIECGDKFSNAVVGKFTECAVSGTAAQCVPQRQDDGSWPVPKEEALVKSFSAEALQARPLSHHEPHDATRSEEGEGRSVCAAPAV